MAGVSQAGIGTRRTRKDRMITLETIEAKSARVWGEIAREAAQKAIETNRCGEWQWSERHLAISRHASRMELLMTRRAQ